ncbi:MAG: methyltransferase [Oscillospiraceae bacterium]|nr:methyltransferase [Oscillospiraceae bacterium]
MEKLWNGVYADTDDSFPLTADAFLLADFAVIGKGSAVCDLGCGAGAVSMMLLANDESVCVTGVDVREDALAAARNCAEKSGVANRFSAVRADWRALRGTLPFGAFDAVVANPPYFAEGADGCRAGTDLDGLCHAASQLLKNGGRCFFVYRAERLTDLLCAMRSAGIEPKTVRFVRHRNGAVRKTALIAGTKGGGAGVQFPDDLIFYDDGGAETPECRRIYHR